MTDSDNLINQDTGSEEIPSKTIKVPFEKYEISLKLGPNNEFIDIVSVSISKDFRSHEQKMRSLGYHDVSDFYKPEEEK